MTRPWIIWLLSLCCAAGVFAAMGVITHRSLSVEQEVAQARAEAELQGRIRLALWRMETEVSALMIEENNRPPEDFAVADKPSPLATSLPKHVRLHCEIAPDGSVTSPQEQTAEAQLRALRELLARSPGVNWTTSVLSLKQGNGTLVLSNGLWLDVAAKQKGPFELPAPVQADAPQAQAVQEPQMQQRTVVQAEAFKQQAYNTNELNRRAQVYTKSAQGKNFLNDVPSTSSGSSAPAAQAQPELAAAPIQAVVVPPSPAEAQPKAEAAAPMVRVTPFRPFWLENELFLVREVAESGKRHVQGVWLDAASLKASLLEAIADILPQAALQPVTSLTFTPAASGQLLPNLTHDAGDPLNLVGLPWRLVPGEKTVAMVQGWTPMRLTLAAAWLGALLAALAAAALLFGVTRLSERRAAFVSSVTHELRTPLTTFRLYSELLEQGMVRDETDRAQYLHTLRTEAERLTHLVDNVLAYSRIERTDRHARRERFALAAWLERIKPRLDDRAHEAGLTVQLQLPRDDAAAVETDATALEQIVFNLVDNACKYAAGRCVEPVVHVSLSHRGRWAELRVCDSGPGIARAERARLFRPFHKSADEAANSKPGVGLGLALCHQLARALGGKLTLETPSASGNGACFVLRLPTA